MSIISSCVLSLCAWDERNGHKATWEHLLRVTSNLFLEYSSSFSSSYYFWLSYFVLSPGKISFGLFSTCRYLTYYLPPCQLSGGRASTGSLTGRPPPLHFLTKALPKGADAHRWMFCFLDWFAKRVECHVGIQYCLLVTLLWIARNHQRPQTAMELAVDQ